MLDVGLLGGIIAVKAVLDHDDKKYYRKVRNEKGEDIAIKGEKVIAIEDVDGDGIMDDVRKGDIFTVKSYSLHSDEYTFEECGTRYDPYLGEYVGQRFRSKHFKRYMV